MFKYWINRSTSFHGQMRVGKGFSRTAFLSVSYCLFSVVGKSYFTNTVLTAFHIHHCSLIFQTILHEYCSHYVLIYRSHRASSFYIKNRMYHLTRIKVMVHGGSRGRGRMVKVKNLYIIVIWIVVICGLYTFFTLYKFGMNTICLCVWRVIPHSLIWQYLISHFLFLGKFILSCC